MMADRKCRTCLWFESRGEEAANAYVELLPNSQIDAIFRPKPDGQALVVEFTLAGVPFQILNGGPSYQLSPAASISVTTEDQAETDRLWESLTANGGSESRCGWLVDRFGVSWQIVPRDLPRLLGHSNREAAARVQEAMMGMGRIDIEALKAVFDGNG